MYVPFQLVNDGTSFCNFEQLAQVSRAWKNAILDPRFVRKLFAREVPNFQPISWQEAFSLIEDDVDCVWRLSSLALKMLSTHASWIKIDTKVLIDDGESLVNLVDMYQRFILPFPCMEYEELPYPTSIKIIFAQMRGVHQMLDRFKALSLINPLICAARYGDSKTLCKLLPFKEILVVESDELRLSIPSCEIWKQCIPMRYLDVPLSLMSLLTYEIENVGKVDQSKLIVWILLQVADIYNNPLTVDVLLEYLKPEIASLARFPLDTPHGLKCLQNRNFCGVAYFYLKSKYQTRPRLDPLPRILTFNLEDEEEEEEEEDFWANTPFARTRYN